MKLVFFLFLIFNIMAVSAQIYDEPDLVSCADFIKQTITGVQGGIEILREGGTTAIVLNECKNNKYLFEYSCKNRHPKTPTLKKCETLCLNNGCAENFAEAISISQLKFRNFNKTSFAHKPNLEVIESEEEIIDKKFYKKMEYKALDKNFECEETDDGTDIYKQGKIKITYQSGVVQTYKDLCNSGHTLIEYRCGVTNPSSGSTHYCPFECRKGACQKIRFQGHYGVER